MLDCADLEDMVLRYRKINDDPMLSNRVCYNIMWYLLIGNTTLNTFMRGVSLETVKSIKDFIIKGGYHVKDGRRPGDIEAHFTAIRGYIERHSLMGIT